MESNNKILEALQMQPLSEEEKATRHILGRLWGPIATTKEKTRNGRGYNMELWKKALADEIFCEKVANKSLFLELGHPVDREETDMQLVCACIPELPKIVDGDLYAYVDILDTKNGRLLKTLCDYGFVPGISSRGSGDIMANDDVDPETFFLETWDIVQLPAVKKARLNMCESLDNKKSLSKALCEAYASAESETKEEIKKTLENLGIDNVKLDEEEPYADIPWGRAEEPLFEETDEISAELEDNDLLDNEKEEADTEDSSDKDELAEEAEDEADEDEAEADKDGSKDTSNEDAFTVKDLIDALNDYDDNFIVEFKPIELENTELKITELILDDAEEDKIMIDFGYDLSETNDNIASDDESEDVDDSDEKEEAEENSDATDEDAKEDSEEAIDDGEDEIVESIKELVRKNETLEEQVLSLKNRKNVSDTKMRELTEELEKYKTGFIRVSELASKASKLQKEVKTLNEQLTSQKEKLQTLQTQVNKHKLITESADTSRRKVKELQERLVMVQTDAEATETDLKQQLMESRQKAKQRGELAKSYKEKYVQAAEHYIASKATMLGVTTRDISSKLQENFTMEDIDRVCDSLLEAGRPAFNFGMDMQKKSRVTMKESITRSKAPECGYEIDDDLLELAGLK